MTIKISPEKTVLVLGLIALVFLIANLAGYALKYLPSDALVKDFVLFNLDHEGNLPTYFSSLLMLYAGLLLCWIAIYKKQSRQANVLHWAVLSIIFVCMAIDESASIHELSIRPLRSLFCATGVFYYAWIIPGICFVVFILIMYARFIIRLPSKTRLFFIIGGTIFISGAIGVEMLGGLYKVMYDTRDALTYGILTTIEEILEISGVILFIYGLMDYIRSWGTIIQIDFQ